MYVCHTDIPNNNHNTHRYCTRTPRTVPFSLVQELPMPATVAHVQGFTGFSAAYVYV